MKFEEKVNKLICEAEVPDCLSPENIAIMLKQKTAEKDIMSSAPIISMNSKKKVIRFRSSAAVAACVALALGITALVSDNGTPLPIGYLESAGEVKEAENYSDVYKVIQDAFVKNGTVTQGNTQTTKTSEASPSGSNNTSTITPDTKTNAVVKYSMESEKAEGVDEADIVQTDGINLYYVANNSLYIVMTDNGKMTVLSKISEAGNTPVEMYINGDRLTLISNNVVETPYETKLSDTATITATSAETVTSPLQTDKSSSDTAETTSASETTVAETSATSLSQTLGTTEGTKIPSTIQQNNVVVEIYDISDKTNPRIVTTYKQNGEYISSRVIDSVIYVTTNYSEYQTKPLDNKDDLDNYVPAYYINDQKTYVEAKDICIPSQVNSTSYAIISGLNVQNDNPLVSIKAVLGSVKNIYCSDANIYFVGNYSSDSDKYNTSITRFSVSNGTIVYSANVSVEGTLINQDSMNEYAGGFRIATTTKNKSGAHYSSIFVLGNDLKPLGSITDLCSSETVANVRFNGDIAYVINGDGENSVTVSLADKTNLKQVENTSAEAAYLYKYNDSKFIGLGSEIDEDGKTIGIKLSMFDSSYSEISSISLKGNISDILAGDVINTDSLIFDSVNNMIGIPTTSLSEYGYKNLYYLISYDETNGFVQKGMLEYSDIEKNMDFNRAFFTKDILYAFSNGRIVSAQLTDLKVIDTISLE